MSKSLTKIAVVGVYGQGPDFTTGQAVKCIELIDWFKSRLGDSQVRVVNTYRWKKNPFHLCRSLWNAFVSSRNIILLPAQNGLKVFAPAAWLLNKLFHRSIRYVVIGGWLADTLERHSWLRHCVASFDGVHVETCSMAVKLEKLGLTNVKFMPNYRKLPQEPLIDSERISEYVHVCTYSRVIREKGIADAVATVRKANQLHGSEIFKLDVYGKIADVYKAEFDRLISDNRDVVTYKGVKNADEGVATLSRYFALLFPTYYEGEGFAGTLLDAFAAHTPVIANDWKYNNEIVSNGDNGFIYPYRDTDAAASLLLDLYKNQHLYEKIRTGCANSAKTYSTDSVLGDFSRLLK